MRRHKYLTRLYKLQEAIMLWSKCRCSHPENVAKSDFNDDAEWAIWLGLLKDIRHSVSNSDYRLDGIRLYYYNEFWKCINGKDHKTLTQPPATGTRFAEHSTQQYFHSYSNVAIWK